MFMNGRLLLLPRQNRGPKLGTHWPVPLNIPFDIDDVRDELGIEVRWKDGSANILCTSVKNDAWCVSVKLGGGLVLARPPTPGRGATACHLSAGS
jgi:hypothetical protein